MAAPGESSKRNAAPRDSGGRLGSVAPISPSTARPPTASATESNGDPDNRAEVHAHVRKSMQQPGAVNGAGAGGRPRFLERRAERVPKAPVPGRILKREDVLW